MDLVQVTKATGILAVLKNKSFNLLMSAAGYLASLLVITILDKVFLNLLADKVPSFMPHFKLLYVFASPY